jgi:hypothetical protein
MGTVAWPLAGQNTSHHVCHPIFCIISSRKHTGERHFSWHCGKQFSRPDNLRQHAQTIHADKQEQNERMKRDLTSLHATMAAATKSGQHRTKRSQPSTSSAGSNSASGSGSLGAAGAAPRLIKEEDDPQSLLPNHQRPSTTTGRVEHGFGPTRGVRGMGGAGPGPVSQAHTRTKTVYTAAVRGL